MEGKLPYIIGGVIGIIGGAFLFHYLSGEDEEAEGRFDELHSDIEQIGTVTKDASGILTIDGFLKIFRLVTKHAKHQISISKKELAEERRGHLREGKEDEYRECIKKQIQNEESVYQEVATEVLTSLDIEEQEFMMAQNMHAMNPAFQKVMMEMQLGVDDGPQTPPSFSKEKAKEMFIFIEKEKESSMANLKSGGGMGGMMGDPNNMEATINMIVEHSKVGDKLFEKFGVEEEEFAKSINYYQLVHDPDIQKIMQKSLQGMGPEALNMIAQMQGQQPGGAGGMPPGGMGF